jgi:hypothetical protein
VRCKIEHVFKHQVLLSDCEGLVKKIIIKEVKKS